MIISFILLAIQNIFVLAGLTFFVAEARGQKEKKTLEERFITVKKHGMISLYHLTRTRISQELRERED